MNVMLRGDDRILQLRTSIFKAALYVVLGKTFNQKRKTFIDSLFMPEQTKYTHNFILFHFV